MSTIGEGSPVRSRAAREILDSIVGVAAHEILGGLGCIGLSKAECFERTGVLPRYHRLLEFLLAAAVRDGLVAFGASGLQALEELSAGRTRDLLREAKLVLGDFAAEIELLEHCALSYVDVLRGKCDPLALLFPKGNMQLLESVYRDAPVARRTNRRLAEAVHTAAALRGEGPLRVLEVGAGTGGSTGDVLEALRPYAGRLDYRYTDMVPAFLKHGEARFGREGFVSFGLLDIERALDSQSIELGHWHIVLASHVLHATRDLRRTLEHVRGLLDASGALVFVETCEPDHRWMNFIFGLTDGWWRFDGGDGRKASPLLDPGGWRALLDEAGFRDGRAVHQEDGVSVLLASAAPVRAKAVVPEAQVHPSSPGVSPRAANALHPPSESPGELQLTLERFICASIARSLRLSDSAVMAEAEFRDIGLDSILAQDLLAALGERVGSAIPASILFETRSVRSLAAYLVREFHSTLTNDFSAALSAPERATAPSSTTAGRSEPRIAVVGYACRVPGAQDAEAFWDLLRRGEDAVGELTDERWPMAGFYSSDPESKGRSYSKWAGLLREPLRFDSEFFHISNREIRAVDPQQRLLLETAWEALEHAGYAGHVEGSPVGVFVGASTSDYAEMLMGKTSDPSLGRYLVSGTSHSFLSNRLSHSFGVTGPSLTIDTACSSSLVALHLACGSLLRGECEMAIAAGVNLLLAPTMFVALSKIRALSPTGRCRPFSDDADGYVRSEGSCVVVLKPLDRALADGDHVRAIILGSAQNHAGPTNGVTVPNPDAQRAVVRRALETANVESDSIGYVECHGTGTKLGDPIEVEALAAALRRKAPCAIGSVKSNVGHLEAASGLAGFLKVVLALEHGEIPPTIHVRAPNPLIRFQEAGFFVNHGPIPWPEAAVRRAGVSSFGFGGTNVHVVVQAPDARASRPEVAGPFVLPLSARTPEALRALAQRFLGHVEVHGELDWRDVCFTASVGRRHHSRRLALVFRDRAELVRGLRAFLEGSPRAHTVHTGHVASQAARDVSSDGHTLSAGELAAHYVEGRLDHPLAIAHAGARRIALPSYPFEDTSSQHTVRWSAAAAVTGTPEGATDLVVRSSDIAFPDHSVAGTAVFPGVGWVASAYAAANDLVGDGIITVRGISFLRPLPIASDKAEVSVRVMLSSPGEVGKLVPFEVLSSEGESKGGAVRYAIGHFDREARPRPAAEELFDLVSGCSDKKDIETAYDDIAQTSLEYGPQFRTLRSLRMGTGRVFAELRSSEGRAGTFGPFDPGLMDGAFQACALLVRYQAAAGAGPLFMPFHIERCTLWERLPDHVFVSGRLTSKRDDGIEFELRILASDGRVVGELQGVSLRRVVSADPRDATVHVPMGQPARVHRIEWQDAVRVPRTLPQGRWLVVCGDDAALGAKVAASPCFAGSTVSLVTYGESFRMDSHAHRYVMDPSDPTHHARLLEHARPVGVVHLSDLAEPECGVPLSLEELNARLSRPVFGLLSWLKVIRGGGHEFSEFHFFSKDSSESGERAAALGLLRTAAHESDVRYRAVELRGPVAGELASLVASELTSDGDVFTYWNEGRRQRMCLEPVEMTGGGEPFGDLSGAVIIAGGASGVGLEFAREILRTSQASVALVHRSATEPHHQKAAHELDPSGQRVRLFKANVASETEMQAVAEATRRELGPIHGIIQSAGVLRDRPIRRMTESDLRAVFEPKVHGTWVLYHVTRNDPLRFFYVFSSVSALFGNAAQASHVAANAYEAALATRLRKDGCPVKIFTWGVWEETGSVAHPAYLEAVREKGIVPMKTLDAMAAWRTAVLSGLDDAVLSEFDATRSSMDPPRRDVAAAAPSGSADEASPLSPAELEKAEVLSRKQAVSVLGPWILAAFGGGAPMTASELSSRLGIVPRFQRLFELVVDMCVAEGLLVNDGRRLQAAQRAVLPRAEDVAHTVRSELPHMALPHEFLERCLRGYKEALIGQIEPLSLLFPEGSSKELTILYSESPLFRYFNRRVRAAVEQVLQLASGRPLRILEIGAGTGSCTAQALAALKDECAEYRFTDISPAFLRKARERFSDKPYMQFGAFDVNRSPASQGLVPGAWEAVVAGNVLHATRDLRATVRHAAELLAPGGRLVLLEVTEPGCWGNLIFGLTDGWWQFEDQDIRSRSACVPIDVWRTVLAEQGFGQVQLLTPEGLGQVVLIATKSAAAVTAAVHRVAATGAVNGARVIHAVEERLVADLAQALDRAPDRIGREVSFSEFGLDSLMAMEIGSKLSKRVGEPVSPAVFFDHPTIRRLARYLVERYPACFDAGDDGGSATVVPAVVAPLPANVPPVTPPAHIPPENIAASPPPAVASVDAIAVIGLACRFPNADTPEAYWSLLEQGRSAIRDVPADRWPARYQLDKVLRGREGEKLTPRAGFLSDDVYAFDAATFRTSPAEAKFIDPQQRLFLEVAMEALEDAGYAGDALRDHSVGVYVGASTGHYHEGMGALFESGLPIDPAVGLGNANAVIANRTSYFLNLCGPSMTVDTLCSSSMVAVHLAVQAIRRGECELALAGGVHLHLSPSSIIIDARLGALSPAHRSRTFDADADGFVTAEGAGSVLLKPLARALADGDNIYAVIRGSATIHGGRSNGLAAPNGAAQEAMILKALEQANVDAASIGLVEAHGAATRIGDPVEVGALTRAYRRSSNRSGYCALGSVKTNFGHLEAAAGVAGLMKAILALSHERVPRALHFDTPNPFLELEKTPFYVPTATRPWSRIQGGPPRRAAVSSFGLGGVYAHVVLEEAPQPSSSDGARMSHAVVLSARTETGLAAQMGRLAQWLEGPRAESASMTDVAFTLGAGRGTYAHRVAFVAEDRRELLALLRGGLSGGASGVLRAGVRPVVQFDCGDDAEWGSEWPVQHDGLHSEMRDALEECRAASSASAMVPSGRLASFALRYALARLCIRCGLEPWNAFGTGIGALVAAVVTHRLSLGAAVTAVAKGESVALERAPSLPSSSVTLVLGPSQAARARDPEHPTVTLLASGAPIMTGIMRAFAHVFVRGIDVRWDEVYRPWRPRRVSLPTYPFERQRYTLPEVTPVPALRADNAPVPESPPLWRVSWKQKAQDSAPVARSFPTSWVVFLDDLGIGSDLVERLRARGARVMVVRRGREFRRLGEGMFALGANAPRELDEVVRCFEGQEASGLGVVFGWGLEGRRWAHDTAASLHEAMQWGPYTLLDLVGALARQLPKTRVSLAVLTNASAAVERETEPVRPEAAALAGVVNVIRAEYGWWSIDQIDLDVDADVPSVLGARAFEELGSETGRVAMWRGDRRYEPELVPLVPAKRKSPFRDGGVYVIVGGKTGIGLEVARMLVSEHRARVARVSRQSGDEDVRGLEDVLDLRADVTDLEAMGRALAEVRRRFGRIDGIIHSAGIVQDSLIRHLSREDLERVLAPKVTGTWVLDKLTRDDDLDGFVLFSSASAVLAPAGQAAHVMANAFQAGFGAMRRSAGGVATVIDWGLWSETGYAARDRSVLERVESRGLRGLTTREGLACLKAILSDGCPRAVAGKLTAPAAPTEPKRSEEPAPPPVRIEPTIDPDAVATWLLTELARTLEVKVDEIDPDLPLLEMGLDSVRSAEFIDRTSARYAITLPIESVFKYPTIRALAEHVAKIGKVVTPPAPTPRLERATPPEPAVPALSKTEEIVSAPVAPPAPRGVLDDAIAIIGTACRFPGASDPDAFWRNIVDGACSVRAVPAERRALGYERTGRADGIFAAFIDDVSHFEPLFFGVSPRDAEGMDPQQRLALEVAYHALENAGRAGASLTGSATGVFLGATTGEFNDAIGPDRDMDRGTGAGLAPSIIANRISYCFDLRGPSLVIDTACSSSLVALHMACESLRRNECTMALAGGVNVMLSARRHRMVEKAGVLSPGNRCSAFARDADGYVRGEGAGMVVLKSFRMALADGDRIRAVILGSALNQDGLTNGISAPNPDAQTAVIEACMKRAGVDPSTIGLVEPHGTGTRIGDRIEFLALTKAFQRRTPNRAFCAIGSVKTNIGHLEPAAGVAGIIKLVRALEEKTLPPSLHFDEPSPDLSLVDSPFFVNDRARPWPAGEHPRRAAVSAFGFGGTNCHVILQEAQGDSLPRRPPPRGPQILALSARTGHSLTALLRQTAADVEKLDAGAFADFCFTANVGRRVFPHRVAVVCAEPRSMAEALRRASHDSAAEPRRSWVVLVPSAQDAAANARTVLAAWGVPATKIVDRAPAEPSVTVVDLSELLLTRRENWDVEAVARLWNAGCEVRWDTFHGLGASRRLPGGPYPFDRKRFWADAREPALEASREVPAEAARNEAGEASAGIVAIRSVWEPRAPLHVDLDALGHGAAFWVIGGSGATKDEFRKLLQAHTVHHVAWEELSDSDAVEMRLRCDQPSHIVFFGAARELGAEKIPLRALVEDRRVEAFMVLLKAVARWRPEAIHVGLVSDESPEIAPIESSLRALARAASWELRRARIGILRVPSTLAARSRVEAIVAALGSRTGPTEIRWQDGAWHAARFEQVIPPRGPKAMVPGGVYLLVGGGSGIGAALARRLAGRGARIAIVGRSEAGTRVDLLKELTSLGGEPLYLRADATSLAQMSDALRKVRRRWGRIDGVFFLPGLVDREAFSIDNKDIAAFRRVQAPKVLGAAILAELLGGGPQPRFVALASSLASISGAAGAGLADYAAANGFLDGLAERMSARGEREGTRWMSLNWSLWDGVGMGALPGGAPILERIGAAPIREEDAFGLLDDSLLAFEEHQVGILGAARGQKLALEPLSDAPSPAASRPIRSPAPRVSAPSDVERAPRSQEAPPAAAKRSLSRGEVESFLVATAARLLRIEPSELDPEGSLAEYGVDSLIIADLLAAIERHYGRAVEPSFLLENPTIRATADHLVRQSAEASGRVPETQVRELAASQ